MSDAVNAYALNEKGERPWGYWAILDVGENFAAKRIVVKPGARISLQRHKWRSEHWVVVSGVAEVIVAGDVRRVEANGAVFIPAGATHRLGNVGSDDLIVIEVQCGERLEESDIERLEDNYGRT